jgi:hypothetical protein
VQEENLVLRGRPHRLLLLRDNLLHSTRGGGATTARLPQMLDARARTARQPRPPRTPGGGDRENGVGPSGAGAGRGGRAHYAGDGPVRGKTLGTRSATRPTRRAVGGGPLGDRRFDGADGRRAGGGRGERCREREGNQR